MSKRSMSPPLLRMLTGFVIGAGPYGMVQAQPPVLPADPNSEGGGLTGPRVGQVTGAVPPTQIASGTTAATSGNTNPALYANGLTGGVGNGIVVAGGGGITAENLSGTGLGVATAMNGGTIDLGTNSVVNAVGSGSASGIIGATAVYARYASGSSISTISAQGLSVSASSDKPYAIYAHTDSRITLSGLTTISTSSNGTQGWGLVSNAAGVLTAQDVNITMGGIGGVYGDYQIGISAYDRAKTTATGSVTIDATGNSGTILFARYADAVVNVNNISGSLRGVGSTAEIAGASGGGSVIVPGAAQLAVNAATTATGLYTNAGGSVTFSGNSTLTVNGTSAAIGLNTYEGGSLVLANSAMTVASAAGGSTGVAIESEAAAAGTPSTITVSNSTISSNGDGVRVTGGTLNLNLTNTTLSNASSNAIHVGDNAGQAGTLNFLADAGSHLTGSATTVAGSIANLTLSNGSTWTITGDSNLTNLANNASLISFAAPAVSSGTLSPQSVTPGFKSLTVNNYGGVGGTIALNTMLAGDGAPSDRLVIDGGTASGSSKLRIANAGGQGALTTANGITVVDTANGGTTAAGAFALDGRVVAGAYEYQLFRGSSDGSNANAWYLRSEATPVPPDPPTPPEPPKPLYRPEIAAYLANQHLVGEMFVHSLHDRLGEPQYVEGQGFNPDQDKPRSGWLRAVGNWQGSKSANGIFKASTNSFLLHGGAELAKWKLFGNGTDRGHLGLMGSYGYANTNATAQGNPFSAKGTVEGWSVGGYATWYQNDEKKLGAYVYTWVQYGWFTNHVDGQYLPSVRYNAQGWAASGETGYAVPLRNDWIIEPQGQLIYVGYNESDITEPTGTSITGASSHGWITRLGARFHRTFLRPDDRKIQPYLTLNWWHTSVSSSISFNDLPLGSMYPSNRYEVKLGVNADLGKRWTAWSNVSGAWGAQSFYQYALRVGVKYAW